MRFWGVRNNFQGKPTFVRQNGNERRRKLLGKQEGTQQKLVPNARGIQRFEEWDCQQGQGFQCFRGDGGQDGECSERNAQQRLRRKWKENVKSQGVGLVTYWAGWGCPGSVGDGTSLSGKSFSSFSVLLLQQELVSDPSVLLTWASTGTVTESWRRGWEAWLRVLALLCSQTCDFSSTFDRLTCNTKELASEGGLKLALAQRWSVPKISHDCSEMRKIKPKLGIFHEWTFIQCKRLPVILILCLFWW